MPVTSVFAAILALFGLFLSIQIVRVRREKRVSLGSGEDKILLRRMRAFGNFTEYTPLVLILLALVEAQGASTYALITLGSIYLLGRFAHAYSIYNKPSLFRVFGMAATYIVIATLAIYLLVYAGF